MKVSVIFDIGKTNKKCFVFDENLNCVWEKYVEFEEITDDDGDSCDDLFAIMNWVTATFKKIIKKKDFEVENVNFSTYGASFVHIDSEGKPVTHLYNYLKPYPQDILDDFYKKYGDKLKFSKETASPALEMLNSGLQLYWIKKAKPEIFSKIKWSMHFPQYLSFLFTGEPVSEYTSIGCHTALWNFEKRDYHRWVKEEGLDKILPPVVNTATTFERKYGDHLMKIGVGIHDSSSALLPYILVNEKPFLLISTGTWSITLNPFNHEVLTREDLKNDCLNFMQIDGNPVKASRLFLGNEYKKQVNRLNEFYDVEDDFHKRVKFDDAVYQKRINCNRRFFNPWSTGEVEKLDKKSFVDIFPAYEEAFHQLVLELVEHQVIAVDRAIGKTQPAKIYIDGGFTGNDVFVNMVKKAFAKYDVRTSELPHGSAIGAALVVSDKDWKSILKERYDIV